MTKTSIFLACMFAVSPLMASDLPAPPCDELPDDAHFAMLNNYDLCYELEMADREDQVEEFYEGIIEMNTRHLDAYEAECAHGRTDAAEDFRNEH